MRDWMGSGSTDDVLARAAAGELDRRHAPAHPVPSRAMLGRRPSASLPHTPGALSHAFGPQLSGWVGGRACDHWGLTNDSRLRR